VHLFSKVPRIASFFGKYNRHFAFDSAFAITLHFARNRVLSRGGRQITKKVPSGLEDWRGRAKTLYSGRGIWGTCFVDFGLAHKTRRKVEVFLAFWSIFNLGGKRTRVRALGAHAIFALAYKARVKTTFPEAGCPDPPPYHFSGSSLYNFSCIIVFTKVLR